MKVINVTWFNCTTHTIGIVVAEDQYTKQRLAYVGIALGIDPDVDVQYILDTGAKTPQSMIEYILKGFTQ